MTGPGRDAEPPLGTGAQYPRTAAPDAGLDAYTEPVASGFYHLYHVRAVHSEQSAYQRVEVFDHDHFGRMLFLDGLAQTTDRDEFCYHEMLVHPALASRASVEHVLVIGGGDGGTLRRVLEHGPREAVMCEIDEAVTRVSRELLPSVSAGALDDPRARVVFSDGAEHVAAHTNAFDAIIVDSTDPIGAALVLFSPEFYADCARALRPEGVVVTQSGSPMYQTQEMAVAVRNMRTAFEHVEVYQGFVPVYPGVLWSFTVGTNGTPVSRATPGEVAERLQARGVQTGMYTPELHQAAFHLPAFVGDVVRTAGARAPAPSVS